MNEYWVFFASQRYLPRVIVWASCKEIVRWAYPDAFCIYQTQGVNHDI